MAHFEGAKKLNFESENVSPEDWDRLRRENRDLQLERDKLVKKLDKRKNELENEKTNTTVFRQYVEELKNKIKILEKDKETLQVINPARFDPGPALTGEIVEREKNEIETLKSEISSMKTKLVLANQNLEIAFKEIDLFEKLVPELKLKLSEMENELQRKDFTIETTEKQRIQEQAIQNETNLNEQLITAKRELDEKCVALKGDKSVLETQVDVLHVQIVELSEEREKWQRQVAQSEATVTGLQVELQKLGETQHSETETIKKYERQITELTNQITILTAVKENAAISQMLVGKLNQDIKVLETNNKHTQGQLQMELTESKRHRDDLERKLGEMTRELTDKDRKMQHNLRSAGVSNEHVDVLEDTLARVQSRETENNMTIKEMRSEINSFDDENSDLKSEKMILEEKNIDLEESNVQYEKQIEELMQQQTANQQIFKNETEIRELNENLILQQQKEETTTNELENMKTAFETEKQRILEQAIQNETKNEQLIQLVARLEEDNAKLQEEFAQKPSKQELITQLDSTQSKVTELLHKNDSLQKTKNEIEDTLQGELDAARDEVLLLKTETNKQTETIDKQNETIETYIQHQLFEEANRIFDTKDKQISHLKMVNLELEASKQTCDTQIKELNEELQQNRSDYNDLDYVRRQSEIEYSEKRFALEDDKSVLEIQVNVLHVEIVELSEEREKWQRQVAGSEATVTRELQKLGEVQHNETETIKKYEQQSKRKGSKSKYPSTGATNMELTPQLIPQPNKTSKSPSKISFRGNTIHVVKLKAFPNTTECVSKQVICTINKHYELGQLMCIAELATKVGFRNAVAKHAGIKLYSPVGNCDGAYKEMRYFDCPPNYGIFVPLEDVYVPVP